MCKSRLQAAVAAQGRDALPLRAMPQKPWLRVRELCAVPRKDLCIVSGQGDIKSYASSASVHRQFCLHCGSSLFWSRQAGDWADWICIALGTLDSPFSALKQKHAHLESQPLWSSFAGGCMRND